MNNIKLKALSLATILVIMVGVFSGCGILPKEEATLAPPLVAPKKQEYQLFKVVKGDIEDTFTSTGNLVSSDEASLYFKDTSKRIKHINVKVGDTVKKGQLLVESEAGDIDYQVQIQQYNVQIKQVDYNSKASGNDANATEIARLTLLIEQAKLQELLNQQQASRLTSPIDGQVTFAESVKDGESVDPFKTLVTIGNTKKLMVNCVGNSDGRVKVGMKVQVKVDTKTLEGIVISLPGDIKTDNNSVEAMGIGIRVDNLPPSAKIGDSADVNVVLQSKSGVLVVPIYGVQNYGNNYSVQVLNGTVKKDVSVQIGIKTATQMEIVSGLTEGQQIILN
jgi:membrane fusion protein, macrolide-specific efflux system